MRLALDIGGTYLRWEVVGSVAGKEKIDTIDLQTFIATLIEKYQIQALAASIAGQVYDNRVLSAPNIAHLPDFEAFDIPYILENDLKCAALAEAKFFECDYLVALYSGTGLGSGAIENGKIVRGWHNLATEIGHIPYKEAPFRCGCGKDNCLELFASGSAIEKWAHYWQIEPSLQEERIKKMVQNALAHAAAVLITLCNPKILVLGGGVVEHNPFLVDAVRQKLPKLAPAFAYNETQITLTQLENASLEGAKILLERLV